MIAHFYDKRNDSKSLQGPELVMSSFFAAALRMRSQSLAIIIIKRLTILHETAAIRSVIGWLNRGSSCKMIVNCLYQDYDAKFAHKLP